MSDPVFFRMQHHFHNFSHGIITAGSMEQTPGSKQLFFGPPGCERHKRQSGRGVGRWEYIEERSLWFEVGDIVHCHT